jgi:hypothetical protein
MTTLHIWCVRYGLLFGVCLVRGTVRYAYFAPWHAAFEETVQSTQVTVCLSSLQKLYITHSVTQYPWCSFLASTWLIYAFPNMAISSEGRTDDPALIHNSTHHDERIRDILRWLLCQRSKRTATGSAARSSTFSRWQCRSFYKAAKETSNSVFKSHVQHICVMPVNGSDIIRMPHGGDAGSLQQLNARCSCHTFARVTRHKPNPCCVPEVHQ